MTGPPSPPTPTPTIAAEPSADGRLATTTQLVAAVEDALGHRPDEETVEELLVELDRNGYVEWVAVTRSGDHVWDLSESPDRIADAVASAVAERVRQWLAGDD